MNSLKWTTVFIFTLPSIAVTSPQNETKKKERKKPEVVDHWVAT